MTPALLLGLSAGLCWGTSSFLAGLQSRRLPPLTVALWSQIAGMLAISPAILSARQSIAPESVAWGVGAGLIGGIAQLVFYQALAVGLVSIVAPVSACGIVVPVVVAFAMGEAPDPFALAGITAVIAGIIVVSLRPGSTPDDAVDRRSGLVLALGAALGFGTYFVLVDQGSSGLGASPLWTVGAARMSLLATLVALGVLRLGSARWPGRGIGPMVAIGVVDTAGNSLFAYAVARGNLGVVSVLGALYPVVTLLLSRIVMGERLTPRQLGGVSLALAGVALVAAG